MKQELAKKTTPTTATKSKSKAVKKQISEIQSSATAVFAERAQRLTDCGKWLVISPHELKSLIDSFNDGEYDKCGKTIMAIFNNDAQIKTCFEKRAGMLSSSRWEIVATDKTTTAEAQAQIEVLRDFYGTLSVCSSEALDGNGGISDLLRSLLRAVLYGYDASAISFRPSRTPSGRLTYHAKITTNPISFFEARARRLKIRTSQDSIGQPLKGDWLVARYENPLTTSLLTLHFFKAVAEVDWASVCEKFGTPFIVVKTTAQGGSQEWQQAQDLAGMIGANYNAVIGNEVELQIEKLAQGLAPHKEVVDYFDRAIARLLLGGDLDTMSRENSVGSQIQQAREDYLRQCDKTWVEGILDNCLTRPLLARVFPNQKPLAYLSLSSQNERSLLQIGEIVSIAMSAKIPLSKSWLYESLGIPAPSMESDSLAVGGENPLEAIANSAPKKKLFGSLKRVQKAQREQFSPILDRINEIKKSKDDKEAYLKATQLFQNFDGYAKEVLRDNKTGEAISKEVLDSVESPIDRVDLDEEERKEFLNVD